MNFFSFSGFLFYNVGGEENFSIFILSFSGHKLFSRKDAAG